MWSLKAKDMDYSALKTVKMYRIVFLLLGSCLAISCDDEKSSTIALPYYNEPDFTPIFIENKSEVQTKISHKIGDFSFLNEDSLKVSQQNIEGKIHVANFIFTSCGSICPTMTKNMKMVSDSLKNEVVLLSFSVTPWIDKPSVLKKFKAKNNITNPNWHFLTGNRTAIYQLARQSYFAEEDIGFSKDSTEFLHTEHFILVDKSKRIRGVYNGTLTLEMLQLIDDIKTLKAE
jgi:protein SCO1